MQACKNFINDGQCVAFCPLEYIYDPRTYRKVPNVNAKYSYGSICVERCPGMFQSFLSDILKVYIVLPRLPGPAVLCPSVHPSMEPCIQGSVPSGVSCCYHMTPGDRL